MPLFIWAFIPKVQIKLVNLAIMAMGICIAFNEFLAKFIYSKVLKGVTNLARV